MSTPSGIPDLVSDVIHELRSPLVPILGYSEMLLDGRLGDVSARQKDGLSTIVRNARRLQDLIDQLLDLARIESGTLVLEPQRTDLSELIRESSRSFEAVAAQKKARIELSLPPEPVVVLADPTRLRRALMNLITRAVRSIDSGGTVRIGMTRPRSDRLLVCIQDSGRQISERFQALTATPAERAGNELGLTVVEAILGAHHSHLNVEGSNEAGTRMSFELQTESVRN